MSYLHIDKVLGEFKDTSTMPLDCTLNNNLRVIFKYFDNQEGVLSLINEWISYQLALKLNLPIPKAGLACLEFQKISNSIPSYVREGLGFYSTRVDNILNLRANSANILQKRCSNLQDFPRILLFDHLIFNTDRNPGNLLFNFVENKIYIIDHTHVFPNRTIWNKNKLQQCINENDLVDTSVMEWNEHLYRMFFDILSIKNMNLFDVANDFQNTLSRDFIYNVVHSIPDEWVIDCADLDMLVEYINYRLDNLNTICNTILNYKEV